MKLTSSVVTRTLTLPAVMAAAALLGACGQPGPLYLPSPAGASAPAKAASAPPPAR
ncbi:LPS translocon maturation chaperone LptM [Aquabacterium humicola]|uniref:LPS translocon maturation chaperone LptM n=1 Tax=Aquabacterium humicola TaxID=3237377 RepID=UPI002543E4F5|nr:lipoprotein [Rubrivivax pictus]